MLLTWLLCLALAASAGDTAPAKDAPKDEDVANLDLLLGRLNEAENIPPAALVGPASTPPGAVPVVTVPGQPQLSWEEKERARSVEFDKEFGEGAYAGMVDFSNRCRFSDGCNRLKSMDVIRGAYSFVDLEKDVKERKVERESPPYEDRRAGIKTGMRTAMAGFQPRSGAKPSVVADFIKVSDPIVKKIFTTEELVQYAERGAAATDAAPAYAYLGQALNGAGRPGNALAAFDSALQKEPKNQQALEGRAFSRMATGDYPGAVSAARDALNAYPDDRGAYAVLKFSEGRARAGAVMGAPGGASSPPTAADLAAISAAAPGAGFASAPGGFSGEVMARGGAGAARMAGEQAQNGTRSALKLGDARSALAILDKALQQEPGNPALLNLRAQALGGLGRWEEALRDAKAGLALAPGNLVLLNTKALAENRTRRWSDALATSEQMVAAAPRSAWGYAHRAHARGGLGDRASMLSDIGRAAAIDPRFREIAEAVAGLQIPPESDILFLFPGEGAMGGPGSPGGEAAPGRSRAFGVLVGAGIAGGILLALGLLSVVLAPIKDSVVSVFTRRSDSARPPALASSVRASAPAVRTGGLIRGQYEISRQIGQGGMGTVYEGTDRSLGRRVAIKKMREELRVNARERDRFIIEAKTVASLHHSNIVDIYAIAEEGDDVYLVFEFVDGKTVHDLVQIKGRLDAAEAVRVTRAMGEALTYAHSRGVIHRDMKPSNVMLTSAGQVKVMDFGIARLAKDAVTRYSMTNTVVGTPPYMAPEQEQGVVRRESDVYALAVCAYEMLTGKLPFIGVAAGMLMNKINMSYIPPSRAIAGLPEALDEVFMKAFQADPDRRYRTPLEFVTALSDAAGAGSKTV